MKSSEVARTESGYAVAARSPGTQWHQGSPMPAPAYNSRGVRSIVAGARKRNVIVADGQRLVREGFRRLIEEVSGYQVVAEVASSEQSVIVVTNRACDLLILDLQLSGGALPVLARLRQSHPDLPILVLSNSDNLQDAVEALRQGARGCLLKSAEFEELRRALDHVSAGLLYIHPGVLGAVVEQLQAPKDDGLTSPRRAAAQDAPEAEKPDLTTRERQILELLADGAVLGEVARRLEMSVNTVKTHLRSLFRKFQASDRTQMVVKAINSGCLERPTAVS